MTGLSTTRLSSKGQVVIPEEIREKMGFRPGTQFVVIAEKDVVILKSISPPSMKEFNSFIAKARKAVKRAKINEKAVQDAIKQGRKK